MNAIIDPEPTITAYKEIKSIVNDMTLEHFDFDYESKKGNKAARSHVRKLRSIKADLERARVDEKKASLNYGRRIDAEARKIAAEIDTLIDAHAIPLSEVKEREDARIAVLDHRLETLKNSASPTDENGERHGPNYLAALIESVRSIEIDDSWQEFQSEADLLKKRVITDLDAHLVTAIQAEADAREIANLREAEAKAKQELELAEANRAAEQRAREEHDRQIREKLARLEAEAKAREESHEQALIEAEAKAQLERDNAAKVLREQKQAEERREQDRIKAAEEKKRQDAAIERAEKAKKDAAKKEKTHREKIHKEIREDILALSAPIQAQTIFDALVKGQIRHVSINY